jgi:hypothetical protein
MTGTATGGEAATKKRKAKELPNVQMDSHSQLTESCTFRKVMKFRLQVGFCSLFHQEEQQTEKWPVVCEL